MATTKQGSSAKRSSSRSTATRKSGGASRSSSGGASRSSSGGASRSSSGTRNGRTPAKKRPAKRRAPAKRSAASRRSSSSRTSSASSNGAPGAIKQVANTAAKPAVAVGAAAVGLAGGLVLRNRTRRKTVLGVTVPRSLTRTFDGFDAKSAAKTVGQATKRFAKTTKTVSKDLERAGDQAERIGKILG